MTIINNRCVVVIISLRGPVWAHKTSLTPSRFIEVPVPSQESARSYLCVRDIDFVSFPNIFGFWNYFDGVVILLFLISLVAWMYCLFFMYFCYLYSFTDTDDQHDLHIT